MIFRSSETRAARFPNLGTDPRRIVPIHAAYAFALLCLLSLLTFCSSGCASRGKARDWYQGPPELRGRVEAARAVAIRDLRAWHGVALPKDSPRVNLRIVESVGKDGAGFPLIPYPGPGYAAVRGFYAVETMTIYLPPGFKERTLIHELGHNVLYANGHHGDHHKDFAKFFKTY